MSAKHLADLDSAPTPDRRLPVVDRSAVDPQTLQAAEGMEAMFLDYMMKTMRQSVPKNEMMPDSAAVDVYQGMLDSEYAQTAARAGGVGLADQIIAYLEAGRYNPKSGQTPARPGHGYDSAGAGSAGISNGRTVRTGGTDESQSEHQ